MITGHRIWKFTKMHGVGNDFVILDAVSDFLEITPEIIRAIAHRQFGVGADQVLIVENPSHPEADFKYRIFNSDGSEVENCGNGARCFVQFVHEKHLSGRNPIKAEIATGVISLYRNDDSSVTVDMGPASFDAENVGFDTQGLSLRKENEADVWALPLNNGSTIEITVVSMANPHAVQIVTDVQTAPVLSQGPLIESHPYFANRINAGFMQILSVHEINLRVYERGAGETLACGTGACAAVVSGIRRGLLESPVSVNMRGGTIEISYYGSNVCMRGPATTVFEGQIDIDKLLSDIPKEGLTNE
ncbi:diaminopimelate epimerase [Taylorella asinigenitalis]|uniref:Diaminopimelate epimerase n=1 Tax=Taylorella asinigenitalis (strain MCE3) TaxID=1008459 RepID=G4QDE7_TAYAM|nr:diaminopimelate epimerase [Taylorella asinigenitalis]AEP35964.1 Diaminopimelate epimerase [Taylorella asinigenitalis MCE3]